MQVRVIAYGFITKLTPQTGREVEIEVPHESAVSALFSILGVNAEDISLIMVNGRRAFATALLAHGDQVKLFAPVGGGQ